MDKATQSPRGGQGDFITNGLYRRATVLRILGIDEKTWSRWTSAGLREIRADGARNIYVRGEAVIEFLSQFEGE